MTDDESAPEWLHTHIHEPNPTTPSDNSAFTLAAPGQEERTITVADFASMPQCEVRDCFIISTGHGTSGPFVFGGVRLVDFVSAVLPPGVPWREIDVVSADGFGNRVLTGEFDADEDMRPIVLATHLDGNALTREQGLVRLIVPSEKDDALRQVKWIGRIEIR